MRPPLARALSADQAVSTAPAHCLRHQWREPVTHSGERRERGADGKRPSLCRAGRGAPTVALVGMIAPIAKQCDVECVPPVCSHPRTPSPRLPGSLVSAGTRATLLFSVPFTVGGEVTFSLWVPGHQLCLWSCICFLQMTPWSVCFGGGYMAASMRLLGLVLRSDYWFQRLVSMAHSAAHRGCEPADASCPPVPGQLADLPVQGRRQLFPPRVCTGARAGMGLLPALAGDGGPPG